MTNVIKFSNPRQATREAREQACLWLAKLDTGTSKEDLREIMAWLDKDPGHARVLVEAALMWDQVSVLSELSELFPLDGYLPSKRSKLRTFMYATAATIALGVGLLYSGISIDFRDTSPASEVPKLVSAIHETRIGEQSRVSLPDGSEILLNTDTRIEVNYTEAERGITLIRGEGHFAVAKDPARPFRVHAGSGVVEAVGTAFTVQHLHNEVMQVTVIEGEVSLSRSVLPTPEAVTAARPRAPEEQADVLATPKIEVLPLAAGESATVSEEEADIQKRRMQPNELEGSLAWRHGMLLFQGSPLQEVITEVSRYTSIKIEVDDSVKDIQVFGYFPAGNIDGLLLTMKETFKVDVKVIDENHIVLGSE